VATVVTRRHKDGDITYKVQWLLGGRRGAPWQSETFSDRRAALKFQALVDAYRQRGPIPCLLPSHFDPLYTPISHL
jgi:hypothetical protein